MSSSSNWLERPSKSNPNTSSTNDASLILESGTASHVQGAYTGGIPAYPRRLWNVSDVGIPRRSRLWPKPVVHSLIPDTTVAVVGIRIAECLRIRSIAAEYDDETYTAVCRTVDGCIFTVYLWHGIIVECMRTSGSTIAFHTAARAVLLAAEGLDSGHDRRKAHQVSPSEYPRLLLLQEKQQKLLREKTPLKRGGWSLYGNSDRPNNEAMEGLERVHELLCKERFECQRLGLESLVCYTDSSSVSASTAKYTCQVLLAQEHSSNSALRTLRHHVHSYATPISSDGQAEGSYEDEQTSQLRTLALRILANVKATTGVSSNHSASWTKSFLEGAARPATASLPGPHDSALVCAIVDHVQDNDTLERCIAVGRATHVVLHDQARRLYDASTEAQREC